MWLKWEKNIIILTLLINNCFLTRKPIFHPEQLRGPETKFQEWKVCFKSHLHYSLSDKIISTNATKDISITLELRVCTSTVPLLGSAR
jgi:hypothetical protein